MSRHWLLTWTTYGTWLPGDTRGFVSEVRDASGEQEIHNIPQTKYDSDRPALHQYTKNRMKSQAIYLTHEQASVLIAQFQETAKYRDWRLLAVAIMRNHAHLVVEVSGDPEPARSLLLELSQERNMLLICVTHSNDLAARFPRHVHLRDGKLANGERKV